MARHAGAMARAVRATAPSAGAMARAVRAISPRNGTMGGRGGTKPWHAVPGRWHGRGRWHQGMARLVGVMARLARTLARPARVHGAIPSHFPPKMVYYVYSNKVMFPRGNIAISDNAL
jgi:hypothetical protein